MYICIYVYIYKYICIYIYIYKGMSFLFIFGFTAINETSRRKFMHLTCMKKYHTVRLRARIHGSPQGYEFSHQLAAGDAQSRRTSC